MTPPPRNPPSAPRLLFLPLLSLALVACAGYTAPVMPPPGLLYGTVHAPLGVNFDHPIPVGSNITRHGQKRIDRVWLPLQVVDITASWNDNEVAKIARANNIEKVAYADYEISWFTPFYSRFTIHVYGN